jgi:hypothetical protein
MTSVDSKFLFAHDYVTALYHMSIVERKINMSEDASVKLLASDLTTEVLFPTVVGIFPPPSPLESLTLLFIWH